MSGYADISAVSHLQATVHISYETQVSGIACVVNSFILELAYNIGGIVRGAIVDDDEAEIGLGLAENRFYRLGDLGASIVYGHEDVYFRGKPFHLPFLPLVYPASKKPNGYGQVLPE